MLRDDLMHETQRRHPEGAGPHARSPAEDLSPVGHPPLGEPPLPPEEPVPDAPSLTEDIAGLIESGKTYAQAEIAFQKTRASLAGKAAGKAAVQLIGALVLVHIALVALAVGLIIALAPLITIWGAIGVVVGGLLLLVAVLVQGAKRRANQISAFFAPEGERP